MYHTNFDGDFRCTTQILFLIAGREDTAVQLVRNEDKCRRKQIDAGERMEGQMTPTDHSLQVPD